MFNLFVLLSAIKLHARNYIFKEAWVRYYYSYSITRKNVKKVYESNC